MNWKSTTLTRPARPIKPVKEKSGDPSEKFAFVAASMIALDEVPRVGRALFTASGEMKKAPKKLIATETMAKKVRASWKQWQRRFQENETPKRTRRVVTHANRRQNQYRR